MLTSDDRTRIQVEVQTGQLPPKNESRDARDFRLEMVDALREAKRHGTTLELPNEWD